MAIIYKKPTVPVVKMKKKTANTDQPFNGISTAKDMALTCLEQGIAVIPISKGSKHPTSKGWTYTKVTKEQVSELFPDGSNIGILLGAPSNGIVDIDLDSPEAVALAPAFLPSTACMFGRASNPRSHYLYQADGDTKTTKFQIQEAGAPRMLLEVRSTKSVTMVPPSVHPNGEKSRFEKGKAGLPSKVQAQYLIRCVTMLAIASTLARVWPHNGSHCRNDLSLAVAGGLIRAGYTVDEVKLIIGKAAAYANDDEVESRIASVELTAKKINAGHPATGWPKASGLIGEEMVKILMKLAGVGQPLSEMVKKELVEGAKATMTGVLGAVNDDPGAPFTPDAVKALSTLDRYDKPEFVRIKSELKKAGVSIQELNKTLKEWHNQNTKGNGQIDDAQYVVKGGCICQRRATQNSSIETPLGNFAARIVEEVVQDDGLDRHTSFAIEGQMADGRPLNRVLVQASQFASMGWVASLWGSGPSITPGNGSKDHLRAAIQCLSGDVPRSIIYQHTGWRRKEDKMVYLHGGGAISEGGVDSGVVVDLGQGCVRFYQLPPPPEGETLIHAIQSSIRFLDVADDNVSMPLLMAVYRALLGEDLATDFSLFVEGQTGTYKSAIAGVIQAHFGSGFDGRSFPANWSGTANALEKTAFLAKDAVVVVDDFCPTGSQFEVSGLHRIADRLLRAQGNLGGRSRMNPDGSLKAEYYPRGLIISTGEDIPKGASLVGRMLILEVKSGTVKLDVLTELQKDAARGILAQAVAGYVRWLAPQMGTLKPQLTARKNEYRENVGKLGHSRTPDIAASLMLGWEMFLAFATESGAVDDAQCAELNNRGWEAIKAAALAQSSHHRSEDPVEVFFEVLQSAISSGRAHLIPLAPLSLQHNMSLDDDGDMIGWIDSDSVYLIPGVAFATVRRLRLEQGGGIQISETTFWKRLREKNLLASWDETRGRNQVRKTIAGKLETVIHIHRKDVFPTEEGTVLKAVVKQDSNQKVKSA
ncbi:MAG: bifunctional DNA primase/polymerase [Magnetococcales bacterium]|nr:bifunctional DNA primase/polymerase [Magnetococcales bacterium]